MTSLSFLQQDNGSQGIAEKQFTEIKKEVEMEQEDAGTVQNMLQSQGQHCHRLSHSWVQASHLNFATEFWHECPKVMFSVVLMWDAVIEFSSFFCNTNYGLATLSMAMMSHTHSSPVSSEVKHSSLMIVITNLDTGGHHLHRRVEYQI